MTSQKLKLKKAVHGQKHANKQRACVWLIGYAQCYKALNITFYAKFVFCIFVPEDFWVLMYHLLGIVYDKKHPWIAYHIGGIHLNGMESNFCYYVCTWY